MLEIAAAEWKTTFERGGFESHPALWAGYFTDDVFKGALSVTQASERVAFWLATPFASSPIDSLWMIADKTGLLNAWELRLGDGGFRLTSWWIPYSISDHGRVNFTPAEKRPGDRSLEKVLSYVGHERLTNPAPFSYEAAYRTAIWLVEHDYEVD